MNRKLKLLTGLSALALLGGCGAEGEGEGSEGEGAPDSVLHAENEGEGEGLGSEGEGEGEGGAAITSDADYLHQLGLIEGHLTAFAALFEAGEVEHAITHAKHPESEIYAVLVPIFETRQLPGFAEELRALVGAIENGDGVLEKYQDVRDAINANKPAASIQDQLLAISKLLATAGDEFALGVGAHGEIANAHEYQDALGFVTVARQSVADMSGDNDAETSAIATSREQVEIAKDQFDGWGPSQSDGDASVMYGAAARVEIAALGL